MKRVALYILFLLINLNLNAQVVYPIRSYTILQPPLPYNLNGFVSEPGKISLNIIVDDVDLDQYAVKFRLHIEGNGIKLTTRPDFFQQPYYLEGAGTHTLTGFDLEGLLNPDNLIFEGYSRNQYKQTGRLPEGVYRIWVDLYDYYRNVKVSMSSPGIAMIFFAKAPRLNFPLNQTEIDSDAMQNIRFSWFSILPADPLADVRYRFKLFEIRPDGRDPYEITRVMQPIYQEETNQSSFVYDAGMPPLISGMSYAWKVEAYDLENRVLFQNDGHSDVLSFRYGKSCVIPELTINEVKSKSVSLAWITDAAATEYTLAYKRTKDENWQEEKTDLVNYTLTDLDDNAGYQIKIKAGCGDSETEFGRVQELKTTREVNYACGNKSDKFDLSNTEPLPSLGRFDEFKAADFLVEVEEVSGGNGNFTGKGYALIPYLGFLKFRVEFESIFVNSDSRMTSGEIKFVYDEATGMIVGETPYGGDEDDGVDVKDELDEISNKVIESDTDISSVTVSGDNILVTHTDGTSEIVPVGDNKVISVVGGDDVSGKAYVVDAGSGQVFTTPKKVAGGGSGSSAVGTGSQTGKYGCSVSFSKAATQRYGFDLVGDGRSKPDSYFSKSKTGEKIDWKSLESGSTDFVDLSVGGNCSPDSLRYLRESGLLTPSAPQGKGRRLLLTGLGEGEEDILTVALANNQYINDSTSREILTEAGALGLVSYDRISRNVVLVPVNGAQCPDNRGFINKELNDIYASAVVDWTVSIEKNLEVAELKGKTFEHSGTGTLSKYTSDMRTVINEFKRERSYDRNTLYLFFIDENTATKTGFMPLASEYGFIFNFKTDTHVLAHELGHSKDFNLRHTFSEKAQHFLPERSTQNLMDYAGGSELWKYQWDLLHNPESMLFAWSQDESEGAKNIVKIDALFSWLKSNYGNTNVDYNYYKLNEQYIWDFAEAYNQFTFNEKDYSTIVWLTDKTTTVNITNPYVDIDLTGDFHVEFTIAFNFSGTSNEAIKFTTYTYQDFNAILGRIGIKLTDAYKKKITDKYTELFANTELTSDCNKIDVLFEGIPAFVLENISGTNRVGYIKTLLSCVVNEGGWIAGKRFDTNEELALLNLFRNFPTKETPDVFLEKISSEKVGDVPLVKVLVSSVDNKYLFIGDDSRKQLMIELLSLFSQTQTYKTFSSELNTKLSATTVDPAYAKQLSERTVAFDYKSIYARSWMDLKLGIVNVDPYLKIDADVNSQGKVSLNSYLCYGFVSTETADIKNPREFSAFAPIIFDQKSTLGALEGFDKVFIAPAIFAYYADKEAGIKTATDVTQAGIDVATLLVPGGQLTKLGRVFFYADKISSITSLAAGFAETNENVKNVLSGISLVTGIVSVGENIVKPSQTEKLLIKSENLSKSKSVLQSEFKALVENINKLSPEELKQIEKAQENLAQFIDGYRKELGLSEDVTADAVKRLKGITEGSGLASTLKKITGKSSVEIPWKNLDDKNIIWASPNSNVLHTAKSFANETGSSLYDIVLDGGDYAKFDLSDGRILLGNTDGTYSAFAVLEDAALANFKKAVLSASDEVFNTKLAELLSESANKLKVLSGATSKQITIAGKNVTLSSSKVNTFLGRFRPDIRNLFNECGSFKNVGLGETLGGINLLNKPDHYYDASTWWAAYNKPWLNNAIERGDDIYLATIPQKADDIFDATGKLDGAFAEELNLLVSKNYKPKNLTDSEWGNIKSWF